jgi:hypothetical protein
VCGGDEARCDDSDPCTVDTCDPDHGCKHALLPACSSTFCTLTQGAYGAAGGAANGPRGLVTLHPEILPAFVGSPGSSPSVTV